MSDFSNEAWATLAPAAPSGLTAAAVSASQITLSWNDVTGETSYKVLRSSNGGGTWTQVATVGANVTSYQNTGLASATTYSYCVVATNAGGDSAASGTAAATTPVVITLPHAP